MKNLHVVTYTVAAALTMTAVPMAIATPANLVGKNYVQQLNTDGSVARTFITGNIGDGTDSNQLARTVNFQKQKVNSNNTVELPISLQGEDAVLYLGADFNKVAADNHVTPEKLKEMLSDDTMHLDTTNNHIFVVDNTPNEPVTTSINQIDTLMTATVADTISVVTNTPSQMLVAPNPANAFLLHSKPGASKVIYLNFVGGTVTGSVWSAKTPIVAPAYDVSGTLATFDTTERNNIYTIWSRVAEDYIPFDVDITTEPPTSAALLRTSTADVNYGTTVMITNNVFSNCGCGGSAYIGVVNMLNAQAYNPAWVFQGALQGNSRYIAEAASHEAGHTLGLLHDGTASLAYYLGHGGSSTTSWAPIMGAGYYTNVTQWSAGVYPGANNQQNDLAVMASYGFTASADDYGNTTTTAATLPMTTAASNNVNAYGVIETNTDIDMFVFNTAGSVNLNINTALVGANLDIIATLTNSAGTVVQISNPIDLLSASIVANVPAGTYYLTIAGTGKAAVTGNPGYPAYASLGQYQITGTVNGVALAPPVAKITTNVRTSAVPYNAGFDANSSTSTTAITGYAWNFGDGTTATTASSTHAYTEVGVYTVSLTITNAAKLTSTATTTVTATAPAALPQLSVVSLTAGINLVPLRGFGAVTLTNRDAGATVCYAWSGYFKDIGCVKADMYGYYWIDTASLITSTAPKTGTAVLTVTSVTKPGFTYNATTNKQTSTTVTR